MPVGYCKRNYVATPIAAVISDVESLPGKINTVPDTWDGVIDLANAIFCIARSRKKSETAFICQSHWHTFAISPRDFVISFDGSSVLRFWTLHRHTRQYAMLMTSWARAWRVERSRCQRCETNAVKIWRPDISGKVWGPAFWMCHGFPSKSKAQFTWHLLPQRRGPQRPWKQEQQFLKGAESRGGAGHAKPRGA